jgi:L-histidine N-alpha-methyltransferase
VTLPLTAAAGTISTLNVLLTPADLCGALEQDALHGLTADPKTLPPKYFYDDRGSELFEVITRVPEYYPARAERSLLVRHAEDIAALSGAEVLLELGSGSSEKTRILLDALDRVGTLAAYVAVDVSRAALSGAQRALAVERPTLPVHAVVADFEEHLAQLPAPGQRMVAFLGGTIGNFQPAHRADFLAAVADSLSAGETFLPGVDLVKDPARLVAAYDDAAGVAAEFNKNVLRVLNRELDADFNPDDFTHIARWDADHEWIEMRLRSERTMAVRLSAIDLDISLGRGEEIRTEISAKFRREKVEQELATAGLSIESWWTDGDYALVLGRR